MLSSFNPWYVGGGVKSKELLEMEIHEEYSFNPWYVGGGVKRSQNQLPPSFFLQVSILGMLEGVLKAFSAHGLNSFFAGFNPWYVGGGVKRRRSFICSIWALSFNPWYVGGGVKRRQPVSPAHALSRGFNPWYVGGGVKSQLHPRYIARDYRVSILGMLEGVLKVRWMVAISSPTRRFQSLVCWRGC